MPGFTIAGMTLSMKAGTASPRISFRIRTYSGMWAASVSDVLTLTMCARPIPARSRTSSTFAQARHVCSPMLAGSSPDFV